MKKRESFFWTSYSDLMTSLFFVMLVLFVLSLVVVQRSKAELKKEAEATKAQLDKIKQLNGSIEQIDKQYFEYDAKFKRHTLKNIQVRFNSQSANIQDLDIFDIKRLLAAGQAIQRFMERAQEKFPDAEYLLIIEGQSSKDNYTKNYELSYQRALALVKMWEGNGINFDGLPCELIISGSGQNSKFRVKPDVRNNAANQRFVIHIIPKPGTFE